MYILENSITFAEINKTTELKIIPIGSKITGKTRSRVDKVVICQNRIIILLFIVIFIAIKNIIIDIDINIWKDREGSLNFVDGIIKSKIYIFVATTQRFILNYLNYRKRGDSSPV